MTNTDDHTDTTDATDPRLVSRRQALKGGGTVVAFSSLAGCISISWGGGDDSGDTDNEATDDGETTDDTPGVSDDDSDGGETEAETETETDNTESDDSEEADNGGDVPSEFELYGHQQYHYTIRYPSGWEIDNTEYPSPVRISDPDTIDEIWIGGLAVDSDTSAEERSNILVESLDDKMSGFEEHSRGGFERQDGEDGIILELQYDYADRVVYSHYLVVVENSFEYLVEVITPIENHNDEFAEFAEETLSSFTIEGTPAETEDEDDDGTDGEEEENDGGEEDDDDENGDNDDADDDDEDENENNLGLDDRTLYTNDELDYEIEHPTDWVVDDSDETQVAIEYPDDSTLALTIATSDADGLDQDEWANRTSNNILDHSTTNLVDEETLTIESGEDAWGYEITRANSELASQQERLYGVLVVANDTVYNVQIGIPDDAYTSTFESAAIEILESLAITAD